MSQMPSQAGRESAAILREHKRATGHVGSERCATCAMFSDLAKRECKPAVDTTAIEPFDDRPAAPSLVGTQEGLF